MWGYRHEMLHRSYVQFIQMWGAIMTIYTDEYLLTREDKMTTRNLNDLLELPINLRSDAYAEAHYAMNMTPLRPSEALHQAIRTVRDHNGRPIFGGTK